MWGKTGQVTRRLARVENTQSDYWRGCRLDPSNSSIHLVSPCPVWWRTCSTSMHQSLNSPCMTWGGVHVEHRNPYHGRPNPILVTAAARHRAAGGADPTAGSTHRRQHIIHRICGGRLLERILIHAPPFLFVGFTRLSTRCLE